MGTQYHWEVKDIAESMFGRGGVERGSGDEKFLGASLSCECTCHNNILKLTCMCQWVHSMS